MLVKKGTMIGRKANGLPDSVFDKRQLAIGIKIEMEHTTSKRVAKAIAKDHLFESPNYYRELVKMEKKLGI
jgi:hypothetical protein